MDTRKPLIEGLESRVLMDAMPLFEISSPETVDLGEAFSVAILTENLLQESYDVKIAPFSGETRISSEIFNGSEWKNTHYYLTDSFPSTDTYNLKINETGNYDLVVRLRNDSGEILENSVPINVVPESSSLALFASATGIYALYDSRRKTSSPIVL